MKKYNVLLALGLSVLAITFIWSSCKKDKCKDVTCKNNGTCEEGICKCPAGFSGVNCEIADPCYNVQCLNGGTCNNGVCTCASGYFKSDCSVNCKNGATYSSGACLCATGYYGADCGTECSTCAGFVGNYKTVSGQCGESSQYDQSISVSTSGNKKITINNIRNKGWNVIGDVTSSSAFTLAQQSGFSDGTVTWKIESTQSCTMSGTQVTLYLKFTNEQAGSSFTCSAFMTKQ